MTSLSWTPGLDFNTIMLFFRDKTHCKTHVLLLKNHEKNLEHECRFQYTLNNPIQILVGCQHGGGGVRLSVSLYIQLITWHELV
jgi:hypothetical protein